MYPGAAAIAGGPVAIAAGGLPEGAAAELGLEWYAEHTQDAIAFPGKHPNIDRLLQLQAEGGRYTVKLLPAA